MLRGLIVGAVAGYLVGRKFKTDAAYRSGMRAASRYLRWIETL